MDVKIVRSRQRSRTVSAREVDGYLLVRAPAGMSDAELQPIVDRLKKRLQNRQVRQSLDHQDLEQLAHKLNRQYFDGTLTWKSIRWVANQEKSRWASCTPPTGTIRLSHRLVGLPAFVVEYVLMHELAHLVCAGHGPEFWALVNRYPKTERARGYLMALGGEDQEQDM
jgi:predicted metal-dependent hydrolase